MWTASTHRHQYMGAMRMLARTLRHVGQSRWVACRVHSCTFRINTPNLMSSVCLADYSI